MGDPLVSYAREGHVARITLDRPQAMNAMNRALIADLDAAVARYAVDDEAWVAVLAGAGRAFSTGGDLKEALELVSGDPAAFFTLPREGLAAFEAIKLLDKPVIAAVHGYAMAGGLLLANACHLVVAAEGTQFGLPETSVGMPTMGYIDLWRTMGPRRLLEAALTAEPFDAETAREWGLVNRVVPEGQHLDAALALAARIAGNAPRSVQGHVQAIRLSVRHGPAVLEDLQHAIWDRVVYSEDMQEGLAAFRERRQPQWRNR